jgi:hypothetical protein
MRNTTNVAEKSKKTCYIKANQKLRKSKASKIYFLESLTHFILKTRISQNQNNF